MPEKQERTPLKRNKNKKNTMTCLSRAMQHHPIWIGNHVINILSVPSSYHLILVKDTSALSVKQKPSFPSHELTILEIKRQPSSNTSIPEPLSMRTHTRKGKNTFWCMLGCNCHLLSMRWQHTDMMPSLSHNLGFVFLHLYMSPHAQDKEHVSDLQ